MSLTAIGALFAIALERKRPVSCGPVLRCFAAARFPWTDRVLREGRAIDAFFPAAPAIGRTEMTPGKNKQVFFRVGEGPLVQGVIKTRFFLFG